MRSYPQRRKQQFSPLLYKDKKEKNSALNNKENKNIFFAPIFVKEEREEKCGPTKDILIIGHALLRFRLCYQRHMCFWLFFLINEKQLRIVYNIMNTEYLSIIKTCSYQITALWVKTEKSYAPLEMAIFGQNQ